jgi:hypothetical protein
MKSRREGLPKLSQIHLWQFPQMQVFANNAILGNRVLLKKDSGRKIPLMPNTASYVVDSWLHLTFFRQRERSSAVAKNHKSAKRTVRMTPLI